MKKRLFLAIILPQLLFSQKAFYLEEIKKSAEKGWQDHPRVIAEWKRSYQPSVLWGYNSPGQPIYLASSLALLYELTKETSYARRAAELLASYGDLRQAYPKEYWKTRVRTHLKIRESGLVDEKTKKVIEHDLASSADFIFHSPEWVHTSLRAETTIHWARWHSGTLNGRAVSLCDS
ncbi:MAG TPA: hypothetical protein DCP63_07435 [Bacteroidetes bacterium]|nr:hypothetical protein [Bacteroidota bacterium]